MAFSEFRGNPQIVAALRGALRVGRVPHAFLFTGPRVGKSLASLCAGGKLRTGKRRRLRQGATPASVCAAGRTTTADRAGPGRGAVKADAATVERVPLILQSHPTFGRRS